MRRRGKRHIFSRFLEQRGLLSITAALFFFILSCFNSEPLSRFNQSTEKSAESTDLNLFEEDSSLPIAALLSEKNTPDNYKKSAHHIVLFLGYGFTDGEKKEDMLDFIGKNYGFTENGGIISVLSYPEYVNSAGRIRVSALTAQLKALHRQNALTGFIAAGSPQGMHTVLAALQDADMIMPVFSLFSQDEVLGTEAGSSLVFDYRPLVPKNHDTQENSMQEETDYEYTGDAEYVLSPLIQAVLHWERIKDDAMLIPALRTEFFRQSGCSLITYVDPVTGLKSKNHYVLTDAPKDKK